MAAKFPSAIATDADLSVAVNRAQTTLSQAMGSGDTTANLTAGSAFPTNCLISIDGEICQITANGGTNSPTVSRAYDGTTAAAHASLALVSAFIVSRHHNQLVQEVEALETALGANLANIPTAPVKYSNLFNFAPITPTGSPSIAIGAKTLTFTLPPGITADSVGIAQLLIAGGTGGGDEVVPITGVGTGTATVTCANTHSGAYTIQSATSGVQEAVIATAGYGQVRMPGNVVTFQGSSGASTVPGCVNIPGSYFTSLRGLAKGVTDIHVVGLTGNRIYFMSGASAYVDVGDFTIRDSTGTMHTSGAMIRIDKKTYGSVNGIEVENGLNGIQEVSCQNVTTYDCVVGSQAYPFYITSLGVSSGSGGMSTFDLTNCRGSSVGTTSSAFRIEGPVSGSTMTSCSGGAVTPGTMNQALQIVFDSTTGGQEITCTNCIFDAGGVGVGILGDGISYPAGFYDFSGCECAGSEYGIEIDAKICNVSWTGGRIKGAGGSAQQSVFLRNAQNIRFDDVDLECLGTYSTTVDTVTDVRLNGLVVGKNSTTPTNVLNFNGPAVRLTLENSDFSAVSSVITGIATAANALRLTNNVGLFDTVAPNVITSETGANNALVAPMAGVTTGVLQVGMRGSIILGHTLRIGANTLNWGGTGVKSIKSCRNPASDIAAAYIVGSVFNFFWDGTVYQDTSQ